MQSILAVIQASSHRLVSSPLVRRAFHTFWQTFTVVFVAGISDILNAFSSQGLKASSAALLALVVAAGAAGLSALKTQLVELSK
jgi:hypothetical protein